MRSFLQSPLCLIECVRRTIAAAQADKSSIVDVLHIESVLGAILLDF